MLYVALLIFSVGVVGGYSYWNVWQLLVRNKISHLRARAKPVIEHWLQNQGITRLNSAHIHLTSQAAAILALDLTSRDSVALVLDRHGKILADGKRLPEEPDAPVPVPQYYRKALAGENEISYRATVDGMPALVLLIPIRVQPGSPQIIGVIQLSTSLADINQILFRHGFMLIAVVAIILILGSGVGFWLTGSSLKDLHRLAATCRRIAKGNFTERAHFKHHRDEIGHLAASFNQMIDRIEAAFASQQRFVANAAHELLTPLTGLRGSLEVLLRGAQDDPAAVAQLSKGMYQELNRPIRLCEQLLGLSRLEGSANLCRQRISLPEFFNDFLQQALVLARDMEIQLDEGPFVAVMADPDMLRQILLNLLSNAIRHSTPGSTITLGWRLLPDMVEIWLSDQGEGIEAKILPHIFEPFYQGPSRLTTWKKGAGLGLALAKSMVEVHGGTIRIESEPNKGTTALFTLPLE